MHTGGNMKSINSRLWKGFAFSGALLVSIAITNTAVASEGDSLETLSAGAAIVLDADISMNQSELDKLVEEASVQAEIEKREANKLVMANVNESVNVRAEAHEEAEKVGKLYKDCGGEILESTEGWTKIKSGDLVGWIKNEYLFFGEEAKSVANDVGRLIATIHADALRIRKEKSEDAGVYGLVGLNERVEALAEDGEWIEINYEGSSGYISSEFVELEFEIDYGETMEVIKERERKEAEEKAKLKQNRGAVPVGASDVELLAALIQCEAGGESYEGQLAVGAVVMNRVRSGAYPSTVSGVIYASGQFTPALNGKVAARVANGIKASCIQAAQAAIAGESNIGGFTHFRRNNGRAGIVIGNHVFY